LSFDCHIEQVITSINKKDHQHQSMEKNPFSHPKYNTSKKPKLDNGHGKWRGRERYILHLGEYHDKGLGMDTVTKLGMNSSVTKPDMDLPVKIQFRLRNGLFNHALFFSDLVKCFDHGVFVMKLTCWG